MASELAPAARNFGMTMMQASSIDPRKYPDWTAFMAKLEAAEEELAQGRPEDFKMLWTHTDDATLSGGLGGTIELGWAKVAARLDWASSNYVDRVRSRQEITSSVEGNIAYHRRPTRTIEAGIAGNDGVSSWG